MGFRAPLNAIIFIIAFIVAGYKAIWKSYVCINACWADVREMHSEACWISKAVQITFTHISMLHAEKISMWFGTVLCSDRMASARIALLFWFRQTFKIDMFRKLGDKNIFRRNSRDVANWGNGWAAGECVCVCVRACVKDTAPSGVGITSSLGRSHRRPLRSPERSAFRLRPPSPSAAASLGLCHN